MGENVVSLWNHVANQNFFVIFLDQIPDFFITQMKNKQRQFCDLTAGRNYGILGDNPTLGSCADARDRTLDALMRIRALSSEPVEQFLCCCCFFFKDWI